MNYRTASGIIALIFLPVWGPVWLAIAFLRLVSAGMEGSNSQPRNYHRPTPGARESQLNQRAAAEWRRLNRERSGRR